MCSAGKTLRHRHLDTGKKKKNSLLKKNNLLTGHDLGEEAVAGPQYLLSVADRATQHAPEHIAPPFVGRDGAVL